VFTPRPLSSVAQTLVGVLCWVARRVISGVKVVLGGPSAFAWLLPSLYQHGRVQRAINAGYKEY
jgi:hypothetical protein